MRKYVTTGCKQCEENDCPVRRRHDRLRFLKSGWVSLGKEKTQTSGKETHPNEIESMSNIIAKKEITIMNNAMKENLTQKKYYSKQ